jgi:hypothetical protein
MGSWSVYCGLSNLTIVSGQKCVFLPLKKNKAHRDYSPYVPATLPIFGEYDDYGGIEDIVKDKNTELIEQHFNCTIEEFCHFFTRGKIRSDESDFPKNLKKVSEIEDWTYMWIDRKVYDFLVANRNKSFGGVGDHNFGRSVFLNYLGFKFIGESDKNPTSNPNRFKQIWTYGDETFYSDGTWLNYGKNASIYSFYDLSKRVKLTSEQLELQNKYSWELWHLYEESEVAELIFNVIGIDGYDWRYKFYMKKFASKHVINDEPKTIEEKYAADYKTFGDLLCQLTSIRFNLHCMSHYWAPYLLHLTPQCGEIDSHQKILESFAAINKEYMKERDYEMGYEEEEDEDIVA